MLYKLPVNVFLRTFGGRQILIQVQILPLITWLTRFLNLSLLVYKMGDNYTRHTTYNLKHIANGYKNDKYEIRHLYNHWGVFKK